VLRRRFAAMGGGDLSRKQVPWCSICLVVTVLTCHVCVLVGNLKTSAAMTQIGSSTSGWSQVGIGVGRSLDSELTTLVDDVAAKLVNVIDHISMVTDTLEMIVSVVGNATEESVASGTANATLMGVAGMALLQTGQGNISESIENLKPYVLDGVEAMIVSGVEEVSIMLDNFFALVKPVLETVGEWVTRFGDKVLTVIESFGTTMDRVQKIFDQITSDLGSGGDGFDTMLYETWGLFDLEARGNVSVQNLKDLGSLYAIQALSGTKPQELLDKYDQDGNGVLTSDELPALVQDDSLSGAMAVMLRTYATQLAEIGSEVGAGVMRDEVALGVARYFQLVCAKNYSKVTWVSDALGNGSLPSNFTGTVYAELCLQSDSVDKLTTMDTGALVIDTMYWLHPEHTLYIMDLMSDPDWWYEQGFDTNDQPACIEMVTEWIIAAEANHSDIYVNPPANFTGERGDTTWTSGGWGNGPEWRTEIAPNSESDEPSESLVQLEGAREVRALAATRDAEVLRAMPSVARAMAETNMRRSMVKRQQAKAATRAQRLSTQTSRNLAKKLMSSTSTGVSTTVDNPSADQLLNSGQAALPATRRWAQWLKTNATVNAGLKLGYANDYSGDSSSTLDSFATQIQAMATRLASFVSMMEYWGSDAGIAKIEAYIESFKNKCLQEILDAVEDEVETLVEEAMPIVDTAIEDAIVDISDTLASDAASVVMGPLEDALTTALSEAISDLLPGANISSDLISSLLVPLILDPLMNTTVGELEEIVENALENLIDSALDSLSSSLSSLENSTTPSVALLQAKPMRLHLARSVQQASLRTLAQVRAHDRRMMSGVRQRFQVDVEKFHFQGFMMTAKDTNSAKSTKLGTSSTWTTLTGLLTTLNNLVPVATETLKDAKTEISSAAVNLNSVFELFEVNGPEIFSMIAGINTLIWTIYFVLLVPMALFMLYYAFWAGGYFGGPQPLPKDEDESERPKTWREKCGACWTCCCACCMRCHDTQLCFWSCVILMQVIVLIMFIISIVLCILAGVKAFITAGCSQIYLLKHESTCSDTLSSVQGFLNTFFVVDALENLSDVCVGVNLLTCELITSNIASSTILTSVFSFVGSVVSLQMIIESAVLHEQARYRRLFVSKLADSDDVTAEEGAAAASSSGV